MRREHVLHGQRKQRALSHLFVAVGHISEHRNTADVTTRSNPHATQVVALIASGTAVSASRDGGEQ
jgi:hypothetical protein